MNSFLKITHTPAQTSNRPSSTIDVKLGINADFLLKDEFPLKVYIKNIFDKKIIYSCELNSNSWCNYPFFEYKELFIYTSSGKLLAYEKWNPFTHGTDSDVLFNWWSNINQKTKGVVIGSNDGASGEYVFPLIENQYKKVLIVEGSPEVFKRLEKNYSHFHNVTLLNDVITSDGRDVIFYEATKSGGETNSILKNHIENFVDKDYREINTKSIGINELLISQGFDDLDWLHIDIEGMDDEVILNLDFTKIHKPKVIIYEKCNTIDSEKTLKFLEDNGYFIWVDVNGGFNNIAFLQ